MDKNEAIKILMKKEFTEEELSTVLSELIWTEIEKYKDEVACDEYFNIWRNND